MCNVCTSESGEMNVYSVVLKQFFFTRNHFDLGLLGKGKRLQIITNSPWINFNYTIHGIKRRCKVGRKIFSRRHTDLAAGGVTLFDEGFGPRSKIIFRAHTH